MKLPHTFDKRDTSSNHRIGAMNDGLESKRGSEVSNGLDPTNRQNELTDDERRMRRKKWIVLAVCLFMIVGMPILMHVLAAILLHGEPIEMR